MAFVRMLGNLLKDTALGPRIVPIVADEARTFGMANLFKQVGIYSSVGQRYAPEDIGSVLQLPRGAPTARSWRKASAKPAPSPAGRPRPPATACTAWRCCRSTSTTRCSASSASATRSGPPPTSARAASCSARPRAAPRWAARACSTRTARSHLVAATIPNCKAYDPAFAGEMAVIVDAGMREMLVEQQDVFYYVTLMNENYAQPDLPAERARPTCCAAAIASTR